MTIKVAEVRKDVKPKWELTCLWRIDGARSRSKHLRSTFNPASITGLNVWSQRFTASYVQEWNLMVEKVLPGHLLWQLNYVGNARVALWNQWNANDPVTPAAGELIADDLGTIQRRSYAVHFRRVCDMGVRSGEFSFFVL